MFQWLRNGFSQTARDARRHPLFFVASVATIAVAIGANVAVFSVVESVLLRPLPFRDPEALVMLRMQDRISVPKGLVNPRDMYEISLLTDVFEGVEGSRNHLGEGIFGSGEGAVKVQGEQVTPGTFAFLGVSPILGRGFDVEPTGESGGDTEDAGPDVVGRIVISHGFWQRMFGGDPGVVGTTHLLNGNSALITGVMPPRFAVPRTGPSARHYDVDLWYPLEDDLSLARHGTAFLQPMARLRPGVTLEQARAALQAMSLRLQEEVPGHGERSMSFQAYPMQAEMAEAIRPQLTVLSGAVSLLLLLACGNVACLLLARGRQRSHETAVMLSMGCPRSRLIGDRIAETAALALVGGAAGLALGWAGAWALEGLRPPDLPVVGHMSMNLRIVAYALLATGLATVASGVIPALLTTGQNPGSALRRTGITDTAGRTRRSMRGLVVLETALSVTLLVGALLLVRTGLAMARERPGYDVDQTLVLELQLGYLLPEAEDRLTTVRLVRDRLRALPGVEAVGGINILPFSGAIWNGTVAWDEESRAHPVRVDYRVPTVGYFEAMGTRIVAGREFREDEEPRAAIVDETLARMAWPGQDPIGRTLRPTTESEDFVVVGVVEHMREARLHEDGRPALYVPFSAFIRTQMSMVMRTSVPPASLAAAARRAVVEVNPNLAPYDVRPLREDAREAMATTRYVVLLMTAFAVLALVLAVVGLYGVLAYTVRLRVTELGIRKALGATGGSIFTNVVGEAMTLAAVGTGLGWAGSYALSALLESLLFGVSRSDPLVFAGAAGVLLLASAVAAGVPARRASVVDPMATLRAE